MPFLDDMRRAVAKAINPDIDPMSDAVKKVQETFAQNPGIADLNDALKHLSITADPNKMKQSLDYAAELVERGVGHNRDTLINKLKNVEEAGIIRGRIVDLMKHREAVSRRNKILGAAAALGLLSIPAYEYLKPKVQESDPYKEMQKLLGKYND